MKDDELLERVKAVVKEIGTELDDHWLTECCEDGSLSEIISEMIKTEDENVVNGVKGIIITYGNYGEALKYAMKIITEYAAESEDIKKLNRLLVQREVQKVVRFSEDYEQLERYIQIKMKENPKEKKFMIVEEESESDLFPAKREESEEKETKSSEPELSLTKRILVISDDFSWDQKYVRKYVPEIISDPRYGGGYENVKAYSSTAIQKLESFKEDNQKYGLIIIESSLMSELADKIGSFPGYKDTPILEVRAPTDKEEKYTHCIVFDGKPQTWPALIEKVKKCLGEK